MHKNLIYSCLLLKLYRFNLFYTEFSFVLSDVQDLSNSPQEHWWSFPRGQLAPRHQLEVVVEEDPEEVQPEAEIEEDLEEVQQEDPVEQPQLYDGSVLEAEADGDIVIPPAPEAAEDAPPAPVAPAPNAMGGDLDDSGDDSGEDDEDNNNDGEDPEEEEDDDPRYHGDEYHKHTTEDENGQFCVLLQEVLQHLGYTMKPLYVTKHYNEPSMRDYYASRVYIRVPLIDTNGWRNRSSHHSTAHFSTDEAAVNDVARRAL
jgi:hypothetical protein